jgi:hypothetical protein
MPAGRPPKPIEQKRRTGNPGKRALPAASNLAVVPAVEPAPLERSAAEVFSQVLADGVHWLGQTDSPTLVILREQLEEREQLRAIVMESGRNDDRKALRDLEKAIRETLSACGFDPAARATSTVRSVDPLSTTMISASTPRSAFNRAQAASREANRGPKNFSSL